MWQVYSVDSVEFYSYSGDTVESVLSDCAHKWQELYNYTGLLPEVSNNFIVGNIDQDAILTDKTRTNRLASHYILSSSSVNFGTTGPDVQSLDSGISSDQEILLPVAANQLPVGVDVSEDNGFYASELASDHYYLDYDNAYISNIMQSISQFAAYVLTGGSTIDLTGANYYFVKKSLSFIYVP